MPKHYHSIDAIISIDAKGKGCSGRPCNLIEHVLLRLFYTLFARFFYHVAFCAKILASKLFPCVVLQLIAILITLTNTLLDSFEAVWISDNLLQPYL